jgi:tRNA threonylcarbamoyl adenosine modification protein YeaZ
MNLPHQAVAGPAPADQPETLVIATGHGLSLALVAGARVLAARHEPMRAGQAEALVPAIATMLGGPGRGVRRIIVETGPGSFTGLRVGLAAARALALAWQADLRGVGSAQLLAAEARDQGLHAPLLVALAAPRGQLWLQESGPPAGPARSLWPEDAAGMVAAWRRGGGAVIGSGLLLLDGEPPPIVIDPRATAAALLDWETLGGAAPLYVSGPGRGGTADVLLGAAA